MTPPPPVSPECPTSETLDNPVQRRPESGPQRTGSSDPRDVRGALEAVTAAAPHLRWRIATAGAPLGPGELSSAVLAADPDAMAGAVSATAAGRGSDDPLVLASLWWQAYAYRVAGTALACWLLTGAAPDVRAEHMAVGIARSRPSSVVYLTAAVPPADDRAATTALSGAETSHDTAGTRGQAAVPGERDLGRFVDRLFAGHLDLVAASLRARHVLGAQLVWGNVAAACAAGVGAVHEAAGADWPGRLAEFLAAAPHGLAGLGHWSFTGSGPEFRRRTCCLWWKTTVADGALCADCSLRRQPCPDSPDASTPRSAPPA